MVINSELIPFQGTIMDSLDRHVLYKYNNSGQLIDSLIIPLQYHSIFNSTDLNFRSAIKPIGNNFYLSLIYTKTLDWGNSQYDTLTDFSVVYKIDSTLSILSVDTVCQYTHYLFGGSTSVPGAARMEADPATFTTMADGGFAVMIINDTSTGIIDNQGLASFQHTVTVFDASGNHKWSKDVTSVISTFQFDETPFISMADTGIVVLRFPI